MHVTVNSFYSDILNIEKIPLIEENLLQMERISLWKKFILKLLLQENWNFQKLNLDFGGLSKMDGESEVI